MSKILIVEDEEYLADMYKIKFEAEGFEVFSAADGGEGFAMAKKERPDLIFLDLIMPVMDGFETLDAIRADADIRNSIVVILSNLGQQEEIDKGMAKGANAFLIKASLTPRDLVAKTREILALGSNVVSQAIISTDGEIEVQKIDFNGVHVLFIEDNREIIQMYRLQFQKSGYNLEIAENGAWGLKLAQTKKFDIIVMDMMMPAMNGYEMLKIIKKDSQNQNTPVIVISNSAQDEDIDKAMAMGANKYLIKSSITPAGLMQEIVNLDLVK